MTPILSASRWVTVEPYTLWNREFKAHLAGTTCYVVTRQGHTVREGFAPVVMHCLYLMPSTARTWRAKYEPTAKLCRGTFDPNGNVVVTAEMGA